MVLDERSPHEPEEPDLGPDPPEVGSDSGPDVDVPDASPAHEGFWGPENAPKELLKAFWALVVLFNVALLAISLGLMVLWFQGRLYLGGGLLAVGAAALARGLYGYRRLDLDELGEDEDERNP